MDIWYVPFQMHDKKQDQKSQLVHFTFYKATFGEEQV